MRRRKRRKLLDHFVGGGEIGAAQVTILVIRESPHEGVHDTIAVLPFPDALVNPTVILCVVDLGNV